MPEISKRNIIKPPQIRGSKKMGPLKLRLSLKKDINLMTDWTERKTETKRDRHKHKSEVITGKSESYILSNYILAETEIEAYFSIIL